MNEWLDITRRSKGETERTKSGRREDKILFLEGDIREEGEGQRRDILSSFFRKKRKQGIQGSRVDNLSRDTLCLEQEKSDFLVQDKQKASDTGKSEIRRGIVSKNG